MKETTGTRHVLGFQSYILKIGNVYLWFEVRTWSSLGLGLRVSKHHGWGWGVLDHNILCSDTVVNFSISMLCFNKKCMKMNKNKMYFVSEQNYRFHLFKCYTREANGTILATTSYVNCFQISW